MAGHICKVRRFADILKLVSIQFKLALVLLYHLLVFRGEPGKVILKHDPFYFSSSCSSQAAKPVFANRE
jgi:hypothetical protein